MVASAVPRSSRSSTPVDVRTAIERALEFRAVDYLAALAAVREIRARSEELFVALDRERVDVVIGPTMASPARRLDEKESATGSLVRLTARSSSLASRGGAPVSRMATKNLPLAAS